MPVLLLLLLGGGAFVAWRAVRHRGPLTQNPRVHIPPEVALQESTLAQQQWVDNAERMGTIDANTYRAPEVQPGGDDGLAHLPRVPDMPEQPALVEMPPAPPPPIIPEGPAIVAQHRAAEGLTPAPPAPEPPTLPPQLQLPVPLPAPSATPGSVPPPPTNLGPAYAPLPPPRHREN